MASTWQAISKRKKEEQWSRIPPEYRLKSIPSDLTSVLHVPRTCGLLTAEELAITEQYDATALAEAIRLRSLKSVDVARAFCKRAAIAHQLVRDRPVTIDAKRRQTNCLTEIFFDAALARAAELDAHMARHGTPVGPLHGVPVSLKDGFRVAGHDATIGYAALAFRPAPAHGPLPALLLRAGAVLYCKTNVPQTLMAIDPHNNLFGRTLNPANRRLTAGGSSGGEGALLALRGSALGVGTDVGGSIRIPAACNALYGVKPGVGRVPYAGQETGQPPGAHRLGVRPAAGPMARSLRDCELFLRAVASGSPWDVDADVVPGDWTSQGTCCGPASAVIGVVRSDGLMAPLPPVQRAMDDTVRALRAAGVRVVELDAAGLLRGCQSLANSLMSTDGYNASFDLLDATGEPPSPWLKDRIRRKAPIALKQARELQGRREALRQEFLRVWRHDGEAVDAFVCPVAPHPVPPVDAWNGVSYTSAFNLLDLPAGVLPVRAVTEADLVVEVPDTKPIGSWDARNRELWTKVDRRVYLGSMLSVQVVAPALQERRLLGAMAIVDDALRRSDFGSSSRLSRRSRRFMRSRNGLNCSNVCSLIIWTLVSVAVIFDLELPFSDSTIERV